MTQLWTTHCGRNPTLPVSAFDWVRAGGHANFTAASLDSKGREPEG